MRGPTAATKQCESTDAAAPVQRTRKKRRPKCNCAKALDKDAAEELFQNLAKSNGFNGITEFLRQCTSVQLRSGGPRFDSFTFAQQALEDEDRSVLTSLCCEAGVGVSQKMSIEDLVENIMIATPPP